MLKTRLTEPRRVVSMYDSAMRQIEPAKRNLYQATRNIEDLGDIDGLEERFTISTLRPLLPRHEHVTDPYLLYSKYCSKIENAPFSAEAFEEVDGWTSMKREFAERLQSRDIIDMAGVIVQLASVDGGPYSPFSLADIDWRVRIQDAERQAAMIAARDIAAKIPLLKPSDSQKPNPPGSTETSSRSTPSPSETPDGS